MTVDRHHYFRFLGLRAYRSDITLGDLVYMHRWTLATRFGSVRFHHILRSDADRHLHDHPFSFITFLLSNGYVEHLQDRPRWRPRFSVLWRPAEMLHRLELIEPVWTFVITGPVRREWGFMTEDGWIHHTKYDAWKLGACL